MVELIAEELDFYVLSNFASLKLIFIFSEDTYFLEIIFEYFNTLNLLCHVIFLVVLKTVSIWLTFLKLHMQQR